MSWFEFWHPAKSEALKAEERYNAGVMVANADQDKLEADTSLSLTQLDNAKYVIIAALVVAALFIVKKYS